MEAARRDGKYKGQKPTARAKGIPIVNYGNLIAIPVISTV
jgi:hypothetical protein